MQHGLDDLPHGKGSFFRPDGSLLYEGAWVNGIRQGAGKMVWANGNSWTGHFHDDHLHGYGMWHG